MAGTVAAGWTESVKSLWNCGEDAGRAGEVTGLAGPSVRGWKPSQEGLVWGD